MVLLRRPTSRKSYFFSSMETFIWCWKREYVVSPSLKQCRVCEDFHESQTDHLLIDVLSWATVNKKEGSKSGGCSIGGYFFCQVLMLQSHVGAGKALQYPGNERLGLGVCLGNAGRWNMLCLLLALDICCSCKTQGLQLQNALVWTSSTLLACVRPSKPVSGVEKGQRV